MSVVHLTVAISFLLVIVIGIFCLIYFTRKDPKEIPSREVSSGGEYYQDSTACLRGNPSNRTWKDCSCHCLEPYTGSKCQHELHDPSYSAIGQITSDVVVTTPLHSTAVDRLSIASSDNQIVCTALCDRYDECIGVTYDENKKCTLLQNRVEVKPGKNIVRVVDRMSNLFLKVPAQSLTFIDRAFVYAGKLPNDFWLKDRSRDRNGMMITFYSDKVYSLEFHPTDLINRTGRNLLFSANRINLSKVNEMVDLANRGRRTDLLLIRSEEETIRVPEEWKSIFGVLL